MTIEINGKNYELNPKRVTKNVASFTGFFAGYELMVAVFNIGSTAMPGKMTKALFKLGGQFVSIGYGCMCAQLSKIGVDAVTTAIASTKTEKSDKEDDQNG